MVTGFVCICICITVIGNAASIPDGRIQYPSEKKIVPGTDQADLRVDPSSPVHSSMVNPVHVGSISTGGDVKLDYPWSVFVAGNYAYVASFLDSALEIVDISNPTAPVHAGSISNGGEVKLAYPMGVFVAGNYAYVVSSDCNALEIVDVSDPTAPVHAGSISNGGDVKLNSPYGVFFAGNYAYVASYSSNALEIVDVSDPTAPVHAGSISNGGDVKLKNPYSVFVAGNYAYVVSTGSRALEIVDVSDPTAPVHTGSISSSGDVKLDSPSSVFVAGNYAYVASKGNDALEIVDVSDPTDPVHAGSISDGGDVKLISPMSVFVAGNYAYVASEYSDALEIVDVSNPAVPVHAGSISDGGDVKLNYPVSIFVAGNYAYVASRGSDALEIVQFTNPTYPVISSITPKNAPNTATANQLNLTGFNFQSGSTVNLTNGTINIPGTVSSLNPTVIRCSFPLTGAPTRTYTVHLLTPGGTTGSLTGTFTVTNATPTISSLTPTAGFNSGTLPVTITGTAFRNGATITLVNGSTTIPGTITSRTTTRIQCTFPLNGTNPGLYNLIIRNTDGLSVTKQNAFTVRETGAYPTILDFNPNSGVNTAVLPFTIIGRNFRTGATVTITNGTTNKTVSGTVIATLIIQCSLPLSGLPFGSYNLTVRNTDGSSVNVPDAFTVNNPAPTITTITPASGYNTGSLAVAIGGSKFVSGCQVSLVNGSTAIPGFITSFTSTKITSTFPLAGTVPGTYTLAVTNPGGPNATKSFTILSPVSDPSILNISPSSGVNTGSQAVTITGTNFTAKASVTITNGTSNTTVTGTVTGTTILKCSLPLTGLPIGLYNLTVRNTDGSNVTKQDAFTVNNPTPVISTLTPASGYTNGSTTVTISGSKFVAGAEISLVNGTAIIPGTITSFTTTKIKGNFDLTHVRNGTYNLKVANPGSPNATKPFTVLSPGNNPTFTNITPKSGVNTAAMSVTIIGSNYRTGATVTITNGSTIKTVTGTITGGIRLTCSLPLTGIPIGLYNVTVQNTDGSSVTEENAFTVSSPNPTITRISPDSGYNTGTVPVTITGTKFASGAGIALVSDNFTSIPGVITSVSATSISCAFPLSGAVPRVYNLTVTNPGGPNATKPFTVLAPGSDPSISGITPSSGLNTGSQAVTITGDNFRAKASVTISNGTSNKTVTGTVTGSTILKCSLPLTGLPIGLYNLTVRNTDGSNVTSTDAFTVNNPTPAITSITPISGYNTGNVQVTIKGTKFVSGAVIVLVNTSNSILGTVTSFSATSISGSFPLAGVSPGTYNLTVSNPGNINGTKPNAFIVTAHGTAPVISSINPASGFNTADLPVTITGSNFNKPTIYLSQGSLVKVAAATAGKTSTATTLYVTLPLKGISGGLYNITVRNPDGVNTTAEGIFYVTDQAWISSTNKTSARSPVVRQVGVPKTPATSLVIASPSGRQVIGGGIAVGAER